MANCLDCENFAYCELVSNGKVDVKVEGKEISCEDFSPEID